MIPALALVITASAAEPIEFRLERALRGCARQHASCEVRLTECVASTRDPEPDRIEFVEVLKLGAGVLLVAAGIAVGYGIGATAAASSEPAGR